MVNKNSLSWILLLCGVSVCISFLLYLLLDLTISNNLIYQEGYDGRLSAVNQFCRLYETQSDEDVILLLGGSITHAGLNANQMEELTRNKYTIYNLGIGAHDPMSISFYTDCYLKMSPSLVIIPVLQLDFGGSTTNQDRYVLASDYIDIKSDDERYGYIDNDLKEILEWNKYQLLFYKRKYIVQYFFNWLKFFLLQSPFPRLFDDSRGSYYDLKNPSTPGPEKKLNRSELGFKLNSSYQNVITWSNNFSESNNPKVIGFKYMVNMFHKNNISVVVVKFPVHPLVIEKLDLTNSAKFNNYMNSFCENLNCTFVDFNYALNTGPSDVYFADHAHLTKVGKEKLTRMLTLYLLDMGVI